MSEHIGEAPSLIIVGVGRTSVEGFEWSKPTLDRASNIKRCVRTEAIVEPFSRISGVSPDLVRNIDDLELTEAECELVVPAISPDERQQMHIGGGGPNSWMGILAEAQALGISIGELRVATVLGGDFASNAIRRYLQSLESKGVVDRSIKKVGCRPSLAYVNLLGGGNQIANISQGTALEGQMDEAYINEVMSGAKFTTIMSPRSEAVARGFIEAASEDEDSLTLYNPHPSELVHPDMTIEALRGRKRVILGVNAKEAEMLKEAEQLRGIGTDVESLAKGLSKVACACVVVTLDEEGAIAAVEGEVRHQEIVRVPPDKAQDSLGAGDNFLTTFAVYRWRGAPVEEALARAASAASRGIRSVGAHASRYGSLGIEPVVKLSPRRLSARGETGGSGRY